MSFSSSCPRVRYRIFHATDLHFHVRPSWKQILFEPKRWIGMFNLHVMGRAKTFSFDVQSSIINEVHRHQPDHVIITGDLTTIATEEEFQLAQQTLKPLLTKQSQPSLALAHSPSPSSSSSSNSFISYLIRGNHDVYTKTSASMKLFEKYFGDFRCKTAELMKIAPGLSIFALDPCQPTSLGSNGNYSEKQLQSLESTLAAAASPQSLILLLTHYPILDRSGRDYQSVYPWHGASNNKKLIEILRNNFHPNLLALHGHDHHGYHTKFKQNENDDKSQSFPIYNPGSSGRSFQSNKRAAAYNLYTVEKLNDGENISQSNSAHVHVMNGWSVTCERFLHTGAIWERESEPYKTNI